jgi:transcription initiation factor TFIIIB Brf1 subunit/transcription initiation factor TFIIB
VEEAEIPLLGADDADEITDQSSRTSRANRRGKNDDDTEDLGSSELMTQGTVISTHFSQHDDSRVMKDRNDTNRIDLSRLRKELKQRVSDRKEKELYKKFAVDIEKVTSQIEGMSPNMKVCSWTFLFYAFSNV